MVHSELPISVLFYDQGGAHLFAMTNGLSGSDATSICCGRAVQSGRRDYVSRTIGTVARPRLDAS
jgi:hypothetical protein